MTRETEPARVGDLAGSEYVLLTTFTADGRPKPTPVWAAPDEDALVVVSDAEAWKVRRARRTPGVTVAACTARGTRTGAEVRGVVTVVGDEHLPRVRAALVRRYGWKFRLFGLIQRVRRERLVGLVVRDVPDPA